MPTQKDIELPLSVQELSKNEVQLILSAYERYMSDPYHQVKRANFHPDVHAQFLGFYIHSTNKTAYPVYKTDHGVFAIDHNIEKHFVGAWQVSVHKVYSIK